MGGAVVGLNDVDGGEGDVLGDLGLGDVQGARGLGLQRVVGGHVVGAGHDLEVVAERAVVVAHLGARELVADGGRLAGDHVVEGVLAVLGVGLAGVGLLGGPALARDGHLALADFSKTVLNLSDVVQTCYIYTRPINLHIGFIKRGQFFTSIDHLTGAIRQLDCIRAYDHLMTW